MPWSYAARNWAMLQYIAADREHDPVTVVAGEGGDELLLGQVFALADQFATGDPGAEAELATFGDPAATELPRVFRTPDYWFFRPPSCYSGIRR